MQLSGVKPNFTTFASILLACATMGPLAKGIEIHQRVVKNGFLLNTTIVNTLIYMSAKCGIIHKARELLDKMHDVETISWIVMMVRYEKNGYIKGAHELFVKIPHPNAF